MEAAEKWILRGNPVRYGSLTLADFFPTPAQLSEVGYDITPIISKAERLAKARGYAEGFKAGEDFEAKRHEPPKALSQSDFAELEYLRGKCEVLEKECDNARAIEKKERKRERIEKNFGANDEA